MDGLLGLELLTSIWGLVVGLYLVTMTGFVREKVQMPYNTLANRSLIGVSYANQSSLYCEHMFVDCQVISTQIWRK